MERSLSAEAVQGSALGKGCVETEQTSDRRVTDKQEKRGSLSLDPGEMQRKVTMMASFTPVRMEPLECRHICCLESREGRPLGKTAQPLLLKLHVASPRWLGDSSPRCLSKRMERHPTKTCKWIFIHLHPENVCRVLGACETECKHVAVYVYGKTCQSATRQNATSRVYQTHTVWVTLSVREVKRDGEPQQCTISYIQRKPPQCLFNTKWPQGSPSHCTEIDWHLLARTVAKAGAWVISGVVEKLSVFITLMMTKSMCHTLKTDDFIVYEMCLGPQILSMSMEKKTGMAKCAQLFHPEAGEEGKCHRPQEEAP